MPIIIESISFPTIYLEKIMSESLKNSRILSAFSLVNLA